MTPPVLRWKKSSFSQHTDCVEVAYAEAKALVRNSRHPTGPHLTVDLLPLLRKIQDWTPEEGGC